MNSAFKMSTLKGMVKTCKDHTERFDDLDLESAILRIEYKLKCDKRLSEKTKTELLEMENDLRSLMTEKKPKKNLKKVVDKHATMC